MYEKYELSYAQAQLLLKHHHTLKKQVDFMHACSIERKPMGAGGKPSTTGER
jgi:hypothetical protein